MTMPNISVRSDQVHKVSKMPLTSKTGAQEWIKLWKKWKMEKSNNAFLSMTGQPGIRSRFATLTILVPPEPPKILQGDFMVTTEDREIELECVSVGGKPAAEVSQSFRNHFDSFCFCFLFSVHVSSPATTKSTNKLNNGILWVVACYKHKSIY